MVGGPEDKGWARLCCCVMLPADGGHGAGCSQGRGGRPAPQTLGGFSGGELVRSARMHVRDPRDDERGGLRVPRYVLLTP